ncbi:hypothetical protein ACJOYH_05690 [Acinetobacter baumannii]
MDNYILKAEDDVINQEALNLFKKLGYRFSENDRSGMIYALNGSVSCDRLEFWDYYRETEGCKEITLTNLRVLAGDCHPQDPALISGAEALRALADGKEVEANNSDFGYWIDARNLSVKDFFDDIHIFRLKPQTIKVELEIPAPYKAKIGGRDDTSFVLNVGRHQYCYKTEEDYTKARDALEAVFDAALRGTNS